MWDRGARSPRATRLFRLTAVLGVLFSFGFVGPNELRARAEDASLVAISGVAVHADRAEALGGARFLLTAADVERSKFVRCEPQSGRFFVVLAPGLYRVSELDAPVADASFPVVRALLVREDAEVRLPFRGAREIRVVPRLCSGAATQGPLGGRLVVAEGEGNDFPSLTTGSTGGEAGTGASPDADGAFRVRVGDGPVSCQFFRAGYWALPLLLAPESPPSVDLDVYPTRALNVSIHRDGGEPVGVALEHRPTAARGSVDLVADADRERLEQVPVGTYRWTVDVGELAPELYTEDGTFEIAEGAGDAELTLDLRRASFPTRVRARLTVAAGWDELDAVVSCGRAPSVPVRLSMGVDGSAAAPFELRLRRPAATLPIQVFPFGWVSTLRTEADGSAGTFSVPRPRDVRLRFDVGPPLPAEGEAADVAWWSRAGTAAERPLGTPRERAGMSILRGGTLRVPEGWLALSASTDVLGSSGPVSLLVGPADTAEVSLPLRPFARVRVRADLLGSPVPLAGWTLRLHHERGTQSLWLPASAVDALFLDVEPGPVEVECLPPAGLRAAKWRGTARAGAETEGVLRVR